jgi:homoserine O-acetyltransferase
MTALTDVEHKIFSSGALPLSRGGSLAKLDVAYETYGTLDASGTNAVLIVHGYTSSHHSAGQYAPGKEAPNLVKGQPGFWDALIGPGKPIDTNSTFVVSVNALGSCHGGSGPNAINPTTGKPYGPDFPEVSVADMAAAQKRLLDHLGVKHLRAVCGPSMGGFQALQWGVSFPDFTDRVVATVTAPRSRGGEAAGAQALLDRFAKDPNWHDGRYAEKGTRPAATLEEMRFETLNGYGYDEILARTEPDAAKRAASIRATARAWAQNYDALSMVVLRRAIGGFDITRDYEKFTPKLLYVLSPTDTLFPASTGPGYVMDMRAAGMDVTYVELPSDAGHVAAMVDAIQWAEILRAFLKR